MASGWLVAVVADRCRSGREVSETVVVPAVADVHSLRQGCIPTVQRAIQLPVAMAYQSQGMASVEEQEARKCSPAAVRTA